MSQIIYVNSKQSHIHERQAFGDYITSYTLPHNLEFSEPHYARLVHAGGAKGVISVSADFVKKQTVNGATRHFLGCSSPASIRPWLPLANPGCLPASGFLYIYSTDGTKLGPTQNFTIIIEIAPHSLVYGTNGAPSQD